MKRSNPPRIATWMMKHLASTGSDEAIAGDLLEHFNAGRSAGWYWRQTIGAIALEWSRRVWMHRLRLLFAVTWCFLSPAWTVLYSHVGGIGVLWRLPWPWSTICFLLLASVVASLFVWLGALMYALLCRIVLGRVRLDRPGVAILSSAAVYTAANICATYMAVYSHAPVSHLRVLTLIGAVRDLGLWTMFVVRLPYFASTTSALWFLNSKAKTPPRLAS
jgi:hypothetical protein